MVNVMVKVTLISYLFLMTVSSAFLRGEINRIDCSPEIIQLVKEQSTEIVSYYYGFPFPKMRSLESLERNGRVFIAFSDFYRQDLVYLFQNDIDVEVFKKKLLSGISLYVQLYYCDDPMLVQYFSQKLQDLKTA